MTVYRVIPVGDLDLSPKDPVTGRRSPMLLTGAAYVRQVIAVKFKFIQGEWFIDQRQGVPYAIEVFVANPNLDRIRTLLRKILLSTQEVSSVTKLLLTFTPGTRKLAVDFDVQLVAGGVISVRQPDPPFIITLPKAA